VHPAPLSPFHHLLQRQVLPDEGDADTMCNGRGALILPVSATGFLADYLALQLRGRATPGKSVVAALKRSG
jgi:hypothetical protein